MEKFRCARKMGGEQLSQTYQQELDNEIQEFYGRETSVSKQAERQCHCHSL